MSPPSTRRRYLRAATVGLTTGMAGCSSLISQNAGDSEKYDVVLRHNFDYEPPDKEPMNVEIRIDVSKMTDVTEVDGETVFEKVLELPPEQTTRRFTDAFSKADDVFEWVVRAEMTALIGDEPLVIDGEFVDAPETTGSDVYRFKPDEGGPWNDTIVVTTDEDTSTKNQVTIEEVSVGSS